MKPYYEDELVTLYHGDCREVSVRADAIIADPPYQQTSLAWDSWPIDWPDAMAAVASSMWVFGSLRMFTARWSQFSQWRFSHDVIWEKHNGSGFQSDRFKRVHEQAAHFYRGQWESVYHSTPKVQRAGERKSVRSRGKTPHMGEIGIGAYVDDGTRLMPSVIYAHSLQGKAENETQKPVSLVAPLIEYACPPSGVVFSPFAGSGTDLLAAKLSGRRAIGCEVREAQCEAAAKRLASVMAEMFA